MNSLVAYGDESDEESPRRRYSNEGINPLRGSQSQPTDGTMSPDSSSSQFRERKDSDFFYDEEMPEEDRDDDGNTEDGFREPAPPRGHRDSDSDSPVLIGSMSKAASTASLCGLERDTFEKEDARLGGARDKKSRDTSEEPAPPIRQSMEDDEEEEIDRLLEESKDIKKMGAGSEGGSTPRTPQYDSSPKEFEGPATPRAVEETKEVVVPPAPDMPADPKVEEKFRVMFERKARGENINQSIQTRKDFKNPSIYELFIETHEIKEFGSNFPLEQYDPDGFPQECYYDYIAKRQNDMVNKQNAASAAKKAAAGDAPAAKKPKV